MSFQLRSPFDREVFAELPEDDERTLEAKLAAAVGAQREWRRLSVEERSRRVGHSLGLFREESGDVAREISQQMGKPLAQARSEIDGMFGRAEHMLGIAAEALAPEPQPASEGYVLRIEHEPLGVVFNLAAWNYPLLIPINVIVPALCAGNAVLLKHSALTPLCGARFERAFDALGVPGLFAHVVTGHEQCTRLIGDARVDHVAFTGSVEGGRAVHRAAAQRFIDCGLELGGKDPAYVAADSELAFCAPNIVDGACYNAGQSCCAVERAYVHASHYDEFLERAEAAMGGYVLGDPLEESTTLGPMAQRKTIAFLEAQVRDAVTRGARLVMGGVAVDDVFFPPTLLADVPQNALVMQEESFGPILPVRAVTDDDEALALMNDSRFGLTASVWTGDSRRAERFARELETGTVFANRCDYLEPCLPWTGVKDSGRGSTLSRYGYVHLTRRKAVHLRGVGRG
jgi:acyl-CoA reductase-like NAD-dependent aldehyde dehydrogenase